MLIMGITLLSNYVCNSSTAMQICAKLMSHFCAMAASGKCFTTCGEVCKKKGPDHSNQTFQKNSK